MANSTHTEKDREWSGGPEDLGVSSAEASKGFLGSDQGFCPNPLCTGIPWSSYKSNSELEDWLEVPDFPCHQVTLKLLSQHQPWDHEKNKETLATNRGLIQLFNVINHLYCIRHCSKCSKSYTESNSHAQVRGSVDSPREQQAVGHL